MDFPYGSVPRRDPRAHHVLGSHLVRMTASANDLRDDDLFDQRQ